ncbi:MAG: hypothetical protein K9N09_04975 [Candidatus Cloacimonetes bacterium]|nr:hypothetical protein [Candidatus Cloacimonadota bacterium]MCF7813941.1 hypothetical protein [Candidatus Cloacimonadota bacterium]MCF7868035.1 hypothetical protein [Candidatus Cloacimonadota bacterium]MCF7883955.1 hypothetical protein [Candidatus Cloacimonadota bacterium]
MPTSETIIEGLTNISNQNMIVALAWHILLFILLIFIASGWRPFQKVTGLFFSLPLLSVSLFALLSQNPFNFMMFLILSILLIIYALRLPKHKVIFLPGFITITGIIMIVYGWIYPHFLIDVNPLIYVVASPIGLVPCPTLSIVIGFSLLFRNFNSKKWGITLSVFGLFYGIIGILRLGVILDIGLLAGAIILLIFSLKQPGIVNLAE